MINNMLLQLTIDMKVAHTWAQSILLELWSRWHEWPGRLVETENDDHVGIQPTRSTQQ
jgi:hypothetical protein